MPIYLSILLGTAIEGEITLLAAAFAARQGLLDMPQIFIAAFTGTLIADWTWFFVGRFSTSCYLPFKRIDSTRLQISLRWMSRRWILLIFTYRYFYGARSAILILFGHSRILTRWFLLYSMMSIALWTVIFCCLGYSLGEVIANYAPSIRIFDAV